MPQQKFWSRFGQWIKPRSRSVAADRGVVEMSAADRPEPGDGSSKTDGDNDTSNSLVTLQRGQTRVVSRLDDGFGQISDLVNSVRKHLENQDDRTKQIAGAVSQLVDTVSRLPEAVTRQSEHLSSITKQLESVNSRGLRLEETISQMPSLADAQRQTLLALSERIDSSQKAQTYIVESMDNVRGAVGSLTETSAASADSVREMQRTSQARDERLMGMIAAQNRKFTRLFVVAIVLVSLSAIAAGAVLLWK